MDCVFCRIVVGKLEADVVHRGTDHITIRDRNPQAPVHLVVLAARHFSRQDDVQNSDPIISKFFGHVQRAAKKAGLTDYRIVMNCGPGAGQTVMHMHAHILGGWDVAPAIVP